MKNDTTFVRMRSGDHLGHCEKCDWMTGKSAGQNFHENRAKFDQKSSFNRSARWASAIRLASGREQPLSKEQDVASDGERELKENRSLSLLVKVQKNSRHKKYSHGTVGSMSTVVQDLHVGLDKKSEL